MKHRFIRIQWEKTEGMDKQLDNAIRQLHGSHDYARFEVVSISALRDEVLVLVKEVA